MLPRARLTSASWTKPLNTGHTRVFDACAKLLDHDDFTVRCEAFVRMANLDEIDFLELGFHWPPALETTVNWAG